MKLQGKMEVVAELHKTPPLQVLIGQAAALVPKKAPAVTKADQLARYSDESFIQEKSPSQSS